MRTVVIATLLILLSSCKKKDEAKPDPAPGTASPGTGAAPTPTPTPPSAPAATGGLSCDQLVPASVREKYLKDRKIEAASAPGPMNTQCNIADGDNPTAGMVMASCHPNVSAGRELAIKRLKETFKDAAKDVSDVGKGGLAIDIAGMKQYTVWDDDSDCQLNVNASFDVDVKAMTKDILAALPPK